MIDTPKINPKSRMTLDEMEALMDAWTALPETRLALEKTRREVVTTAASIKAAVRVDRSVMRLPCTI